MARRTLIRGGPKCYSFAKPIRKHVLGLRAVSLGALRIHESDYTLDWDGFAPDGVAKVDRFEAYLKMMAPQAAWASTLEVKASTRKFDVKRVLF